MRPAETEARVEVWVVCVVHGIEKIPKYVGKKILVSTVLVIDRRGSLSIGEGNSEIGGV